MKKLPMSRMQILKYSNFVQNLYLTVVSQF